MDADHYREPVAPREHHGAAEGAGSESRETWVPLRFRPLLTLVGPRS